MTGHQQSIFKRNPELLAKIVAGTPRPEAEPRVMPQCIYAAGRQKFEVVVTGVRKRVRTSQGFAVPVARALGAGTADWLIVPALGCKMPETLEPALARPDAPNLDRGSHRGYHLDQIEQGLSRAGYARARGGFCSLKATE